MFAKYNQDKNLRGAINLKTRRQLKFRNLGGTTFKFNINLSCILNKFQLDFVHYKNQLSLNNF
jgi:hypothetical protein